MGVNLLPPPLEPVITDDNQRLNNQSPIQADSNYKSGNEMLQDMPEDPTTWHIFDHDLEWWNMTAQEVGFDQYIDTDFGFFSCP